MGNTILSPEAIKHLEGFVDQGILDSHEALRKNAEMGWQAAVATATAIDARFVSSSHEASGAGRVRILAWLRAREDLRAHLRSNAPRDEVFAAKSKLLRDLKELAEVALEEVAHDVRDTIPDISRLVSDEERLPRVGSIGPATAAHEMRTRKVA